MYLNDLERGLKKMSKIRVFILFPEILLIQLKLLIFLYMENISKCSNMCRKGKAFSVHPLQVIQYAIRVMNNICLGWPFDFQIQKL